MAHQIEIKLEHFDENDHHRVRNFVEDVWRQASDAGWAEFENFDHRIKPGAAFRFSFPARQSSRALAMVERAVGDHMMETSVTTTHLKGKAHG